MRRLNIQPRPDWPTLVKSQGFLFHDIDEDLYWTDDSFYWFTESEIDALEQATYALNDLCLEAVQYAIDHRLWDRFQIPSEFVGFIEESWEKDEITVLGRFDLAYDGSGPPKLLEYNADTPTSLLEAAAVQWQWMKDTQDSSVDQFNSIHERLIEAWQRFRSVHRGPLHLASLSEQDALEDFVTTKYLEDTAIQGGLQTCYLPMDAIGWDEQRRIFVDLEDRRIESLFKLYPWEWLIKEPFARNLLRTRHRVNWLEAPWKMLLSNKAILPLLWELHPECPYLLRASDRADAVGPSYVEKPLLGREGANVRIVENGTEVFRNEGPYGGGAVVYQELRPLPSLDGNHPVIGSWMVNGYACGIGIREDDSPVTGNASRFVPHVFGGR